MKLILDLEGKPYDHPMYLQEALQVLELVFRNRNHDRIAPCQLSQFGEWMTFADELKYQVKCNDIYSIPACRANSQMLLKIRESVQAIPLLLSVGIVDDSYVLARKALEQQLMLSYFLGIGNADSYFSGKYDTMSFKSLVETFPINLESTRIGELYKFLCDSVHIRNTINPRTLMESEIYSHELVYPKLKVFVPNLDDIELGVIPQSIIPLFLNLYKGFIKLPMYFYRFSIRDISKKNYSNHALRLIWQALNQKGLLKNVLDDGVDFGNLFVENMSLFIARGIFDKNLKMGNSVIEEVEKDIRALCIQHEVSDFDEFIGKCNEETLDAFDEASNLEEIGFGHLKDYFFV